MLAVTVSKPLDEVLHTVDAESDNFSAELLLKELGAVAGDGGTSFDGAAVVRRVLAQNGVPLEGVTIADGSGLSSLDRLTPQALVTILRQCWSDGPLRGTLDFSSDSRRVALSSSDGKIRIIDVASGREEKVIPSIPGGHSFAFDPSGRFLAVLHDSIRRTVRVVSPVTGEEIRTVPLPADAGSMCWSRDSRFLREWNDAVRSGRQPK